MSDDPNKKLETTKDRRKRLAKEGKQGETKSNEFDTARGEEAYK